MELVIGNNPELITKAQAIRHQVFVVEQGIPMRWILMGSILSHIMHSSPMTII